ncbi:hypothetical protein IF650_15395 [Cellulosimicrobium terreum]|nr:hypothetical protein [Cellulosimicrobium terreum]
MDPRRGGPARAAGGRRRRHLDGPTLGRPRLVSADGGVEFDGRVTYSTEHGDPTAVLWAEERRHDALVEAGRTILRVTWEDLGDPEVLVARAVRARRRALSG